MINEGKYSAVIGCTLYVLVCARSEFPRYNGFLLKSSTAPFIYDYFVSTSTSLQLLVAPCFPLIWSSSHGISPDDRQCSVDDIQ